MTDAGSGRDAASTTDASAPDAQLQDASELDAGGPGCGTEDCTQLNTDCAQGQCRDGHCVAVPVDDGRACGDTECTVCKAGECGPAGDCSALDGDCTRGMCDGATGECKAAPINDDQPCFDDNPCTFGDTCHAGVCTGQALDCSVFDDECSQGVCDPEIGGCTFGPNRMSEPCDDANPCTLEDHCDTRGFCISTLDATPGTTCTDYNACTGTSETPDACDGSGRCNPGGAVDEGTTCNDDNECTDMDACDGAGECVGQPVREGEPCNGDCSSNTTCQLGLCLPKDGDTVPAFDQRCFLNWCGRASLCEDDWKNDRVCDCGCSFDDPDCNDCSMRMCESDPERGHRAVPWCDQDGKAIDNCPETLKGDGKCDCGCQFVDPDCSGGDCCAATGQPGCGNRFVERCLCEHESNPAPSCCNTEWTQQCADLAVSLGCMVCP